LQESVADVSGAIEIDEDKLQRIEQGRERPSEDILFAMGRLMVHRGPDDHGHYCADGIAVGMRRLSIIDLEGGHQPIPNEDKTVWAVCNGEIYNFKELRAELEARGHVFRCDSDTEVIVHLYEEEGLNLFRRLRGMFAIALWDAARSRLVLARDRLGKKPLYICREPHRVLFASEMKSLLDVCDIPRTLNNQALQEYLALGYVPAPLTMFERIEKLLPGHYMVVEKKRVQEQQYWDVPAGPIEIRSENEWIERVREKLLDGIAQFDRRAIGRLDVADQWQRDLAVGPDLHRLRELRVLVDFDAQLVARAQPVLLGERRRRRRRLLVVLVLRRHRRERASELVPSAG